MRKLILFLLCFIAFKVSAQVIVTQPYIFQKNVTHNDTTYFKLLAPASNFNNYVPVINSNGQIAQGAFGGIKYQYISGTTNQYDFNGADVLISGNLIKSPSNGTTPIQFWGNQSGSNNVYSYLPLQVLSAIMGPTVIDARQYPDLNTAVAAIGSTQCILNIPQPQKLIANLVIPSNISVNVTQGGIITNSTYTLAINGLFYAGRFRVFHGMGAVSFGNGTVDWQFPEWDGASNTGTNSDTTTHAFAVQVIRAFPIKLGMGNYLLDSIASNPSGYPLTIVGEQYRGPAVYGSTITLTAKAKIGITIGVNGSLTKNRLQDFRLAGNSTNLGGISMGVGGGFFCGYTVFNRIFVDGFIGTGAYGIEMNQVQELHVQDCRIQNNYTNVYLPSTGNCTSTVFDGAASYIGLATNRGVDLEGLVTDITFQNIVFESNANEGLYYNKKYNSVIKIQSCYFEQNGTGGTGAISINADTTENYQTRLILDKTNFHANITGTVPMLYLSNVKGSVVSNNTGLSGSGGIVTNANAQVNFENNSDGNNTDYKALYNALLGQISWKDRDINGNEISQNSQFIKTGAPTTNLLEAGGGDIPQSTFATPASVLAKNDTINIAKQTIGNIYNKTYWANLNDFTVTSGFSVVSNQIQCIGDGSYTQTLSLKKPSALDNFRIEAHWKTTTSFSADSGAKVTMLSYLGTATTYAFINTKSGADFGKVFLQINFGGLHTLKSTSALSVTSGDSLKIIYTFKGGNIKVVGYDLTNNTSVSLTSVDNYTYGSINYASNTAYPSFSPGNGTYLLTKFEYSSATIISPDIAFVGHSIVAGYNQQGALKRAGSLLGGVILGGSGDLISTVQARAYEIYTYVKPKYVFLMIGVNDNLSTTAYQTAYINLVDTLVVHGITVINLLATPCNSVNVTGLNSFIETTYPNSYIDDYTPLWSGSGTTMNPLYNSGDGIHPNSAGATLIASTVSGNSLYSGIVNNHLFTDKLYYRNQPIFNPDDENVLIPKSYADNILNGVTILRDSAFNGLTSENLAVLQANNYPTAQQSATYRGFLLERGAFLQESVSGSQGVMQTANEFRGSASWMLQNTSKPGWRAILGYDTNSDGLQLYKAAATSGAATDVLQYSFNTNGIGMLSTGGTGFVNIQHTGTTTYNFLLPASMGNSGNFYISQGSSTIPTWGFLPTLTFGTYLQAGTITSYNGSVSGTLGVLAATAATANTLVARDGSGGLVGNIITATTFYGTNLGIGTSTPQSSVEVIGSGGLEILRNTSATSYASYRVYNNQNSAARALEMGYTGSSYSGSVLTGSPTGEVGWLSTTGAFALTLGTNNTSRLSISSAGVVSIPNLTASKVIFTDASKNLTSTGIGTSSQVILGDGTLGTYVSGSFANPMTTLGDIIYGGASGAATRLAGNTTTTRQFYSQTGTGSASAAPILTALAASDIPSTLNNTTIGTSSGGLTLPGTVQFTPTASPGVAAGNGGIYISSTANNYFQFANNNAAPFAIGATGSNGFTLTSTNTGARTYTLPDASGTIALTNQLSIHSNSTTTGTATTAVTVTIGSTMANTNYYVDISPQDLLTAVNWYVSAKTTTTFTITFVTALTGSINFDWNVTP